MPDKITQTAQCNYNNHEYIREKAVNKIQIIEKISQIGSIFENIKNNDLKELKEEYLKQLKIENYKLFIPCITLKLQEKKVFTKEELSNFVDLIRKYNIYLNQYYIQHIKDQIEDIEIQNMFHCCGDKKSLEKCKHDKFNGSNLDYIHSYIARECRLENKKQEETLDSKFYLERIPDLMNETLGKVINFRNKNIFAKRRHMSRYLNEIYRKKGLQGVAYECSKLSTLYSISENLNLCNYNEHLYVMDYNEFMDLCNQSPMLTQKDYSKLTDYSQKNRKIPELSSDSYRLLSRNSNSSQDFIQLETDKHCSKKAKLEETSQKENAITNIDLKYLYSNNKYNTKYYYGKYIYKDPVDITENHISYLPGLLNSFNFQSEIINYLLSFENLKLKDKKVVRENVKSEYSNVFVNTLLHTIIFKLNEKELTELSNLLNCQINENIDQYQARIEKNLDLIKNLFFKKFENEILIDGLTLLGNEKNIDILSMILIESLDHISSLEFTNWYKSLNQCIYNAINLTSNLLDNYEKQLLDSKTHLQTLKNDKKYYLKKCKKGVVKNNTRVYESICNRYEEYLKHHIELKSVLLKKIQKGKQDRDILNKYLDRITNSSFVNVKKYEFYLLYLKTYKKQLEKIRLSKTTDEEIINIHLFENVLYNYNVQSSTCELTNNQLKSIDLFFKKILNENGIQIVNPILKMFNQYISNKIDNIILLYMSRQRLEKKCFISKCILESLDAELERYYFLNQLGPFSLTETQRNYLKDQVINALFQAVEDDKFSYKNFQDILKPRDINSEAVKKECTEEKINNYTLVNNWFLSNKISPSFFYAYYIMQDDNNNNNEEEIDFSDVSTDTESLDSNNTISEYSYSSTIELQDSDTETEIEYASETESDSEIDDIEETPNIYDTLTLEQINDYYFVRNIMDPLNTINQKAIQSVLSHEKYSNYLMYIKYFEKNIDDNPKITENFSIESLVCDMNFLKKNAIEYCKNSVFKETFFIFANGNSEKNQVYNSGYKRYNTEENKRDKMFIMSQIKENINKNNYIHIAGKSYGTIDAQEILLDTLELLYSEYQAGKKFKGQIIVELDSPTGLDTVKSSRIEYLLQNTKLNQLILLLGIINPTDVTLLAGKVFGLDYGTEFLDPLSKIFVNNKYLHRLEDLYGYCSRVYNSQKKNKHSFFTCIDNKDNFNTIKKLLFGEELAKENISLSDLYNTIEKNV